MIMLQWQLLMIMHFKRYLTAVLSISYVVANYIMYLDTLLIAENHVNIEHL